MSPRLSNRMRGLAGSATSRAAGTAGPEPSIDLGAGSPDWDPPARALEAARAVLSGALPYGPPGGDAALRRRLCEDSIWHEGRLEGVGSLVTTGGKEALFLGLLACVSPGDRVVVCAPYWPSFPEQIRAAGGEPVIVSATEEGLPHRPSLLAALGSAQALIVNSPSNPTGRVWPNDLWELVAKEAERSDVWVVLDGVYAGLCRSGVSPARGGLPEPLLARTLAVDSGSKRFALPGIRIGWAVGPDPWIDAMRRLQDASTTHPSSVGQAALDAALTVEAEWLPPVRAELDARRAAVARVAQKCGRFTALEAEAGLYAWLGLGAGSCDRVLVDASAAAGGPKVLPGSLFGAPGHVRVALRAGAAELTAACERLAELA